MMDTRQQLKESREKLQELLTHIRVFDQEMKLLIYEAVKVEGEIRLLEKLKNDGD
jgi:hypothetical protein